MERIKNCRGCNSENLDLVLDLGCTPLANSLLTKENLNECEFVAPLELLLCQDCSLAQISCTIPPEQMFRNYAYFSSFSETMLQHAKDLCERLKTERKLNKDSLVIEIASNDGYLLKNYNQAQVPTLGIEPALNVAEVAREAGVETMTEFFDSELAKKIVESKGKADVVHAHNVLAHVPNINSILEGLHTVLKDTGIAVIEAPYAIKMIDRLEFDTIYHEHVFYFSVTAINNLLKRNNLVLVDVEQVEIHGGSLRMFIAKQGIQSTAVLNILEEERSRGFDTKRAYESFAKKVEELKNKLIDLVKDLKKQNKKLSVYGAAAKGSTLLNYCGLGTDFFDFAVDRSTAKQGFYMPGIKLPIYDPKELLKQKPDYVLLLTWNFAEEILRQQAQYINQGGQFVIPIPEPKILACNTSPVHA
jgi:SAM-dependent methyltransferase